MEKRVPGSVIEKNVDKRVLKIGIEEDASIPEKDASIHGDS